MLFRSPQAISHVVRDRTINREYNPATDVGTGMHETTTPALHADLSQEDWYIYDENYGTSEEKALVKYIQSQIPALRERYEDIYLLRNEKLFQLYNFVDGHPYEPDFVLFLTDRATSKALNYQLFIEPKGQHLLLTDQWKENFLLQIEAQHEIRVTFPNDDFELIGLPFYNEQIRKQAFEAAFRQMLLP